jgi:uncharacterized protein YgiM (DUF1202 family)
MKVIILVSTLLLLSLSQMMAQSQPVCPAAVLLDFSRAASSCYGLEDEQACIGGGSITATGFDGNALASFEKVGDRAAINSIQRVSLPDSTEAIPVVTLVVQASLAAAESLQATLLLLGNATLENNVPPLIELVAIARGTANLRAQPRADGDILARAGVSESMIVNGRTRDGAWYRTRLRDQNTVAWVAADVVTGDNLNTLPIVEPDSPVYRPFELMTFSTGSASYCDGTVQSGLLFQTPGLDTHVTVQINEAQLQLAGTAFIIAADALRVAVLTGEAVLNTVYVPAGAQGVVGSDAVGVEAYRPESMQGLPFANLPTFVRIAEPLQASQITEAQTAWAAQQTAQVVPLADAPILVDNTCRRFVSRDVSLYAGPGSFYEAINELQAGSAVDPIFQTTDPQGAVWYQLRGSNWIPAARVVEEGDCIAVPVTTNVSVPRNNQLSLETCETTNGPLRAGQRVTIQFTPPPFDNYVDARDAAQIDPGRITIGTQRYRTNATEPLLIAGTIGEDDERWQRQFYIIWEAVPGTYRIEGDRVSYNPICTITVPVS